MLWNEALASEQVVPRMSCHLILVGETKEAQPFCFEDDFTVLKVDETGMAVSLEYSSVNPLEKLHHVSFIEFSFRKRGILYYAFVDLLNLEVKRSVCTLTLSSPFELNMKEDRVFTRTTLPARTPVTCRITGARGSLSQQSVAFSGQILDIAGGGLSFITNTRVLCALYLELSFVLPSVNHTFTVYGEVLRVTHFSCDSYRVAVQFRHLPESLFHQIDAYCSSASETSRG
ncbi:PilZ domain-containing protein [Paenibacillus cremeus]|uniref:PilZ domain-containing protein n=1 Tax=Paenibacillus cremeus TaxID=2163881 RepID=A0A559KBB2_9BACL|nr:PilZ domain-containing protein [Paenibacillus cremeus]TVY09422.1 PilZ domain-containing protein [Paenibacillus cremeus]